MAANERACSGRPGAVLLHPIILTILLSSGAPSICAREILVYQVGKIKIGELGWIDSNMVHFRTNDGQFLDIRRNEVFGVFAEDASKDSMKPDFSAKPEFRFGTSTVMGAVIQYDPSWPYVIYAAEGKARINLLKSSEKLRSIKVGPPVRLEALNRGPDFSKETLKVLKSISKENVFLAMKIARIYLSLDPSGDEKLEIESLMATMRKTLQGKVKDFVKIILVDDVYVERRAFLTYHFYTKLDTFTDLKCSIWAQLSDGTVNYVKFYYFTLRKCNRHHDSVEPSTGSGQIRRWRITFEFLDEVVAIHDSDQSAEDWWKEPTAPLYGLKKASGPSGSKALSADKYCSWTLGKKFPSRKEEPQAATAKKKKSDDDEPEEVDEDPEAEDPGADEEAE